MNVALFFTYDMSLQKWNDLNILDREVKLYNKISNNDIKFTFVTYGTKSDHKFSNKLENIDIYPIYDDIKKHKNKLLRFLYSLIIPFKIKKEFHHIDILKTNQLMGSWIPVMLKFLLRKKLIIRTGYDIFYFSIKEKKNIIKIFLYFLLTQISLLSSDKYIVTSSSDYKFLRKWFFLSKSKLSIIQNYVENLNSLNSEIREDEKIIAVGRLEKQKNYKKIINFVSNSNFELHIFGNGSMESELNKYVDTNDIKNIKFLGSLTHNNLLNTYSKYKFYIILSDFEGNPKTLIEAMSRGCIPIVSNISHLTEVIKDEFNGLILKNKNISIKDFLNLKKIDEETMNMLSRNAFQYANKNFSLESIVKKEIKLYESLI